MGKQGYWSQTQYEFSGQPAIEKVLCSYPGGENGFLGWSLGRSALDPSPLRQSSKDWLLSGLSENTVNIGQCLQKRQKMVKWIWWKRLQCFSYRNRRPNNSLQGDQRQCLIKKTPRQQLRMVDSEVNCIEGWALHWWLSWSRGWVMINQKYNQLLSEHSQRLDFIQRLWLHSTSLTSTHSKKYIFAKQPNTPIHICILYDLNVRTKVKEKF